MLFFDLTHAILLNIRLEETRQTEKVVLLPLLDLMPATEPIPTNTNPIRKTLLSEIYLGQDGLTGFSEDMSSGSTKKLFLACVLEILVSYF